MVLKDKTIVLGVTGSIAAYKAADLASKLTQAGARVEVVMTKAAMEFITPLTFRSITHHSVATDMFDPSSEWALEHIALAHQADLVVIAPATANTISKLAAGIADELLGCIVLATQAPVIIAPAMDAYMYQNPAVQDNVARLRQRGFAFVEPGYGRLASGAIGQGRFADTEDILGTIRQILGSNGDLAGKRVVVSAAGTQEPVDPVRYIGNRASGKMGFAVAEAARDRGAEVTLITGPTYLRQPIGVETISVRSALEMQEAILQATAKADALIMTAAVADYRPVAMAEHKIKAKPDRLTLELVKNPDILSQVRRDLIKVGFAAESQNLIDNAKDELQRKGVDLVAANDITDPDSGFAVDTNRVTLVHYTGEIEPLPLMLKTEVAHCILDRVVTLLHTRTSAKGGNRKLDE